MDHMMKKAMLMVVDDMGKHAKNAKAARFKKHIAPTEEAEETGMAPHGEVTVGEPTMVEGKFEDPVKQAHHIGDNSMSQQEMDELMAGMQR